MSSNGSESRPDVLADPPAAAADSRLAPTTIRRGISRLLAQNPSVMTGPGTNSYVLGTTKRVIVDPGPNDAAHLERLLALGGNEIAAVLLTHHHNDHAPLGRVLADRAGVPLLAFGHESMIEPDERLFDGEVIELHEMSITVLHTPGHAADHCCYLVSNSRETASREPPMLLTGDHVMSGSTVVIAPLDGDMTKYLESLERLLSVAESIGTFSIAPGHGDVISDGPAKLRSYLEHRLEREQMVVDALQQGSARPADLVAIIYRRLAPSLIRPAGASVWAHLRRLGELGQASSDDPDDPGATWSLLES